MLTPKEKGGGRAVNVFPVEIANSISLKGGWLTWTPPTAGDRNTWTMNMPVKGLPNSGATLLFHVQPDGSNYFQFYWNNDGTVRIQEYTGGAWQLRLITADKFLPADGHGVFHLVMDTTNATASERVRLYWNNKRVTSFSTENNPSQNYNTLVNSNNIHGLYAEHSGANNFDGYGSRFPFVDGQALEPTLFWEASDQVTGLIIPKEVVIPEADRAVAISRTAGSIIHTMGGRTADAFDGLSNETSSSSAYCTTSDCYIGKDYGAGNETTVHKAVLNGCSNYGLAYSGSGTLTATLRGSNDNSNWDELASKTFTDANSITVELESNDKVTKYRYVTVRIKDTNTSADIYVSELTFYKNEKLTWGDNGRHYKFDNAANLGEDSSGNGNDATVNGSPVQTLDTPTNNYATLNPLNFYSDCTFFDGNLRLDITQAQKSTTQSTLFIDNDVDAYWEVDLTGTTGGSAVCGIGQQEDRATNQDFGQFAGDYALYSTTGQLYNNATLSDIGFSAYSADQIDFDWVGSTGTLRARLNNGAWVQVATGLTGRFFATVGSASSSGSAGWVVRFGATGFVNTPTTTKRICSADRPSPKVMKSASAAQVIARVGTGAAVDIITPDMTDFDQGALVWIKKRDGSTNHHVADTENGANKFLFTNTTDSLQTTSTDKLTAFNSNGYNLGADAAAQVNSSGNSFLDLCLKAGVDNGFEIVTTTGDDAYKLIPHNLGKTPTVIIGKCIDTPPSYPDWRMWHRDLPSTGSLILNNTGATYLDNGVWGEQQNTISATHFPVGQYMNQAGYSYVFYLFADSDVFRAFSYRGASPSLPFINLGGRPLWTLIKNTGTAGTNWTQHSSVLEPFNPNYNLLVPNSTSAEGSVPASYGLNYTSQGFQVIASDTPQNANDVLHVGLAILERTNKY